MAVLVGIDVGKTNVRVGVFGPDLALVERWAVAYDSVADAKRLLRERLESVSRRFEVEAIGTSIFGPLEAGPSAPNFGAVVASSAPTWSDANIPLLVREACGRPVFFDYDVNAGALAEAMLGAGRDVNSFFYLSVGTGVGGVLFRGQLVPWYAPQVGHMYLPQEEDDLLFAGSCRFHGRCLQGLASGRAMALRWGKPAEELGPQHPAWDLEARYLARACANLVYTFSPHRIVLASSVGCSAGLSARVNTGLLTLLNGFLEPELRSLYAEQEPVVSATLTQDSAMLGAALLAKERAGLLMR